MNKKAVKRLLVGKFSLKRFLRSFLIIYVLVGLWAFFWSDRLIFLPRPSSYSDNGDFIDLTSGAGVKITGLYLPNPQARYTILYSHGNAEDLGDILPRLRDLRDIGFAVFSYDYRGYGLSEGRPTVGGAYEDINAAYDYLRQELKVPAERIIVYGRSVGSGPSVDLASRMPVAGLVVESGFVSAFRVGIPVPLYPFDKFPNINKIDKVDAPVLIMHGDADEVIPFSHAKQLFAEAGEPKLSMWIAGGGHNNFLEVARDRYVEKMQEFVEVINN
ncbi:MAG: alpha/beta hydrolase [Cyanobacteriota bacterium]|nr:alpha/beta hydrolase [Cyanobacteriota bacterium]